MRFTYTVEVEVERDQGKFESRDTIGSGIEEAIGSADPGTIEGENGGEYSVTTWDVTEVTD